MFEEDMHPSTRRFLKVLDDMRELHEKKGKDYGAEDDPFANVRQSMRFGIPSWLGAVLRLNDKVVRIQSFATKGELENESVEDSLRDIAVYAAIALTLYWEETGEDEPGGSGSSGPVGMRPTPRGDELPGDYPRPFEGLEGLLTTMPPVPVNPPSDEDIRRLINELRTATSPPVFTIV